MTEITPTTFKRVYIWEFPVRAYHWVNAICVFALIATGFLIGSPTTIRYAEEAYQQYWFGTVRLVHFVAAFAFFFNFLFRVYWGFVGNRFARWFRFIPHKQSQVLELFRVLRTDILLQTEEGSHLNLGHNSLAGLVYLLSFAISLFQAFTGFALYSSMSSSFLPKLFTWVVPLMGGDLAVRQWHHAGMWFFIIFTMIHVYLVFYHDYVEGRGTTSSMVGGYKFEREDILRRRSRADD
jgi:Ni/Fe-hydrogenase 1 B-type cytochrome subunit